MRKYKKYFGNCILYRIFYQVYFQFNTNLLEQNNLQEIKKDVIRQDKGKSGANHCQR